MSEKLARILTATTTCIARNGIRGVRINDVAAEAGVSPGLLYYHFINRAGLLAATLEHINKQVGKRDPALSAETDNPDQHFRHLLLDEIQDDADIRRNSVAWNELRACAVFERDLADPLARTTTQWNQTVAEALATAGTGALNDTEVTAEILTSLVEGISGRWLNGTVSTDHAHTLLTIAIDALAPSRHSPASAAQDPGE